MSAFRQECYVKATYTVSARAQPAARQPKGHRKEPSQPSSSTPAGHVGYKAWASPDRDLWPLPAPSHLHICPQRIKSLPLRSVEGYCWVQKALEIKIKDAHVVAYTRRRRADGGLACFEMMLAAEATRKATRVRRSSCARVDGLCVHVWTCKGGCKP